MKRFLCALLILCFLPVLAFAESLDFTYYFYNSIAEEFDRETIGEEYETSFDEDGTEERKYQISDSVKVLFESYNDKVYQIAVLCLAGGPEDVFLSACINASQTLMSEYSTEAINVIKAKLKLLNMGENPEISYVDGNFLHMVKMDFVMMFFITNVELFAEIPHNAT